jgi:hypothetical protein
MAHLSIKAFKRGDPYLQCYCLNVVILIYSITVYAPGFLSHNAIHPQ